MICFILAILGWFCVFLLVGPISLDRSLSVSILLDLREDPSPRSMFSDDPAFDKRFMELTKAGLIVQKPTIYVALGAGSYTADYYHLTARGRFVANCYYHLSRITGCKPSC